MLRDDRRMQEGARDLAIAFNIGRAEEAISRLNRGVDLQENDLRFFQRLSELFADALRGCQWVENAWSGQSSPVPADTLKAFQLVVPVLESQAQEQPPSAYLSSLKDLSEELVAGKRVSEAQLVRFSNALKVLSASATRQGMDSFEPKSTPSSFSILPKLQ